MRITEVNQGGLKEGVRRHLPKANSFREHIPVSSRCIAYPQSRTNNLDTEPTPALIADLRHRGSDTLTSALVCRV